MPSSYRQFLVELYEEHLEEIAFLYEQILEYTIDPNIPWQDLRHEESRIHAHLDALIIGESLAQETVAARLEDGDPGIMYAYTLLCCHTNDIENLFSIWKVIDLTDSNCIHAINKALVQACPESWLDSLINYNFEKHFDLLPLYLPLFAYHDVSIPARWKELALRNELSDKSELIAALGHLNANGLRNELAPYILKGTATEQTSAINALYRFGHQETQAYVEHHTSHEDRPWSALVNGCDTSLFANLESLSATPELILALGFDGSGKHIPYLIEQLNNDEIATDAALALFTITGYSAMASVFIEEEWEEDQLFAEELEDFKAGITPKNADGDPFGEEQEQLSTDPNLWLSWWQANQNHFQPQLRYRLGHPLTPHILVATLSEPNAPAKLRQCSYQELVIRYRCPVAFSFDLWVSQQLHQIQQMQLWASSQQETNGLYYFNGAPMAVPNH
jgi:hypothetical protein